jgi:hypothetical protein
MDYLKRKKIGAEVRSYFNSILPVEYTGQPWYIRWYKRLLLEHDWLCLILPYNNERDYRSVRWVRVMVRSHDHRPMKHHVQLSD